jgi:PAS domain S-box-containing protein
MSFSGENDDSVPWVDRDTADAAVRYIRSAGRGSLRDEGVGLYRILVDTVQDYAIFALDPDGIVLSWNAGAQRLKGYRPEDIIGRSFTLFYPPADRAAGRPQHLLRIAARDGRVEDEGWRVKKDGTYFWADVVITALRDDTGQLVGYAKVTRDLTERRESEEQLKASEERFRLLVQNVRDYGIFMLDPNGNIASWNEGAERIEGYSEDEILGRHFSIFYPPEDVAAGKPAWELEVASREGRLEDEGWRVRKDGDRFWANVVITALRNPAGELLGYTKVTRDLTERKAAEERALEDARRVAEAEASSRAKSEFLASMSHELRTPLNAIGGYADLLALGLRGPVTEDQKRDLERIRQSQQHLLGIINDILNYSRIEAGHVAYDVEPVPLCQVIDAVRPMVEPQALTKGLSFKAEPCPPDLVVLADRTKAEQILLNLFSNAVKFTPSGGRITVSTTSSAAAASISVSDTGVGIAPENQHDVFEPFVQIGRSLTTSHEGTGLGLSISRDLARAMGGDLTLRSDVGQGSTFTLTLPRQGAPAAQD